MDLYSFLDITAQQIRSKRARPMVLKELSNHVEDQKTDYMAEGMTDREAEAEAVHQMGDPVQVGIQLDKVHRPRMEWRILIGVILLSLIGLGIQFFIQLLSIQNADSEGTILKYFYLQQPHVIEKQLKWVVVGIIAMFVICRLNYSLIGKYAVIMWTVATILIISYCILATPVNGGYVKIVPLSYLLIPIFAGIVYHYRGRGKQGLIKSEMFLIISFIIQLYIPSLFTALMLGVIGGMLLTIAVCKGWFGERKKKLLTITWAPAMVVVLLVSTLYLTDAMEQYQKQRLHVMTSGTENENFQLMEQGITEIVTKRKNQDFTEYTENEYRAKDNMKGSYLWLYLSKDIGAVFVGAVTLAIFALIFLMFRTSIKQKNRLGLVLGVGCSSVLLIQTVLYIAMNLGILPPASGLYMPLISYGPSNLLITYIYMGLLLSVYRNKDLIAN